jgi:hypothetical protein
MLIEEPRNLRTGYLKVGRNPARGAASRPAANRMQTGTPPRGARRGLFLHSPATGSGPPMTDEGRVLAIVVMFVGIGFLTMLIGAVAERFVAPDVAAEAEEVERDVDEATAEVLRELRDVRDRLDALEMTLRRARQG